MKGAGDAEACDPVRRESGDGNAVEPDVYRKFGFPGADDLGNMFQFKRDFEEYFSGVRKPGFARSLNPSLQDFRTWLKQNKNAIPLEDTAASA